MKKVVILLFIVSFASCGKEKSQTDLPITQDTMAEIVFQMQKAKAVTLVLRDTTLVQQNKFLVHRKDILNKYNVSEQSFDSCWNYYLGDTIQMKILLNKVSKLTKKDLPLTEQSSISR